MSNALTKTNGNHLEAYGQRAEIEEISSRLMELHPNAQQLGTAVMTAVAQLAIISGANPMPMSGEIWAWKNWDNSITITHGIAYYRRKAKEIDTVIWLEQPRKATKEERELYDIPNDGTLAALASGYRKSEFIDLVAAGVPWNAAAEMVKRTAVATVGYYGEQVYPRDVQNKKIKRGDPIQPPKSQTWQIVCNKRAEQALYKMLSLVDTTLTDYISSVNQRLVDVGIKGREYQETDLSGALSDMSLDEFNGALFGDDDAAVIIQAGDDFDQSPPATTRITPPNGRIIDLRAGLEEYENTTLGDVAEKAAETGLYSHENHALNAMKQYQFPGGVRIVKDQKVSRDGAIKVFDWLVERKLDEEE